MHYFVKKNYFVFTKSALTLLNWILPYTSAVKRMQNVYAETIDIQAPDLNNPST